jgi:hypothetical protein
VLSLKQMEVKIDLNRHSYFNPRMDNLGYAQELRNVIEKSYSEITYLSKLDLFTLKINWVNMTGTSLSGNTLSLVRDQYHPQSIGLIFNTTLIEDNTLQKGVIRFKNPIRSVLYLSYKTDNEEGALLTTDGLIIALN